VFVVAVGKLELTWSIGSRVPENEVAHTLAANPRFKCSRMRTGHRDLADDWGLSDYGLFDSDEHFRGPSVSPEPTDRSSLQLVVRPDKDCADFSVSSLRRMVVSS